MDFQTTVVAALISLAVAIFSGWRGALPSHPLRGVRLVPWRMIMLLSTTLAVLLALHLLSLAGIGPRDAFGGD